MKQSELIEIELTRASVTLSLPQEEVYCILNISVISTDQRNMQIAMNEHAALILIDISRYLLTMFGNNIDSINHFLNSSNKYFGAKPKDILMSKDGLIEVHDYIVAMSSKS